MGGLIHWLSSIPGELIVLFVLVLAGYLLAFANLPRVLMQRRESTATLSWVLAVLLVPWLGLLLFRLFGSRRIRRGVRRKRRANLEQSGELIEEGLLPPAAHLFVPDGPAVGVLASAFKLSDRVVRVAARTGNRADLLLDGEATYAALEADIRAAHDHCHLEYYIWRGDATGRRFRDLLIDRAREGVEVRVLVDAAGSIDLPRGFFEPLEAAGGSVRQFLPFGPLARRFNLSLRDHRKLAVIDGRVGFLGGINIGDEYLSSGTRRRRWRDTHVRIEGPAVESLQQTFGESWHFAGGRQLAERRYFPPLEPRGDEVVQVVASGPDERWETIHRILFTVLTQAEESVLLTTPYFIPDHAFQVALETAALRGVAVTLLLPRNSDHAVLDYAARSYLPDLLRAGVKVFEYGPGVMHAKTAVVDGVWSTVGSANMDVRSFRLNFEANLVVYGRDFAERLASAIRVDLALARPVKQLDLLRRPRRQRLLEGAARLLAPVL